MTNFKVGDKVRAVREYDERQPVGVGSVLEVHDDYLETSFPSWNDGHGDDDSHWCYRFYDGGLDCLQLVEDQAPKFKVGDTGKCRNGCKYTIVEPNEHDKECLPYWPVVAEIEGCSDRLHYTSAGSFVGEKRLHECDLLPPFDDQSQAGDRLITRLSAVYREAKAAHAAAIDRTLAARAAHAEAEEAEEAAEVAEQQAAAALLAAIDAA